MTRDFDVVSNRDDASGEMDLRAVGRSLKRRRGLILAPTVIAFVLAGVFVNVVTPRYTGESQILLENQESFFTRPERTGAQSEQVSQLDAEAVGSQIQLVTSRDLAGRAIRGLKLQDNSEFDPAARGISALNRVLVLLGVLRDPTHDTPELRILQTFQDKLTVFSPPKTRVITVQFQSRDPDLAARGANAVAELYVAEKSSEKRLGAKDAADALGAQITDLRVKLAKADAEREQYRGASNLLAGSNNMTISGQQLADINGDLSKARSLQADSQAKASMIRELLRSGKTADVPDVINNDLVRRVSEQRVGVQAQLALESNTLLPGHPRIKELTAQLAGYDLALKAAAKQAVNTLENEAKIAGQRVVNLEAALEHQSKIANTANGDEVRLRSLDRIAQSYKDQLDVSTAKYQEAIARETSTATPADARIIGRATRPQEATFPKKLPIIAFSTIATFVFCSLLAIAGDLLSTSSRQAVVFERVPGERIATERVVADRMEPVEGSAPPQPVAPRETTSSRATVEPRLPTGVVSKSAIERPVQRRAGIARLRQDIVFEAKEPERSRLSATLAPRWFGASARLGSLPSVIDWFKTFGQSAAASRSALAPKIEPLQSHKVENESDPTARAFRTAEPGDSQTHSETETIEDHPSDVASLVARIVASHLPGRGLHVVGASIGSAAEAMDDLVALSRGLADRGRSIIVDLNAAPSQIGHLAVDDSVSESTAALAGLSELLSGDASFAEVIHRDRRSRLHFIPTGNGDADFRDFDLILDALSETYDFITLLAPAFPRSEIAKVMAPYADFVVLTAAEQVEDQELAYLEAELIEAGAREVMVVGRPTKQLRFARPHVA